MPVKCAKINSLLPFPFNCLSLSIKTKRTGQTTPRDYVFQGSSSLKSRTTTGENKHSCLNGERNIFYIHPEIFMICLNASELASPTGIFYLLSSGEIHATPETRDWAWLGLDFCFTLKSLCWGVRTTSRTTPELRRELGSGLLQDCCLFYSKQAFFFTNTYKNTLWEH